MTAPQDSGIRYRCQANFRTQLPGSLTLRKTAGMLHLTARETWDQQRNGAEYLPEPFASEGFIHCTDGEENVIAVGNRYYTTDLREMVCLVIDDLKVASEIRYEDEARIFPHIHGPLNLDAVVAVRAVVRSADGTFTAIGESLDLVHPS